MTRVGTSTLKKLQPRAIGLVVRHHQPLADAFAVELARLVVARGIPVILADESVSAVAAIRKAFGRRVRIVKKEKLPELTDMILVLGGDGTFLSIARLMRTASVPVLGVNMGQLGFLTEIKKTEAVGSLLDILDGKPVRISERALLEITLKRGKKTVFQAPVVNDAVVSKGAIARIIGLDIAVDGRWVHEMRGDGIIISTPTGSTAYSLAAGGPIIEPSLNALLLTAICPHSLTQRPLVLPDTSEIQVHLKERPGHVLLTLDGQDAISMSQGDVVIARRFTRHSLKLISAPTRDYFSVLREKLNFGMRN